MTKKKERKVYIHDTSVLLHKRGVLYVFGDADHVIPAPVLGELDSFKVGTNTINVLAREVIRQIDNATKRESAFDRWVPLDPKRPDGSRLMIIYAPLPEILEGNDADTIYGETEKGQDHRILNTALLFKKNNKERNVTFMTQDIILRLKAKHMGLKSEALEVDTVDDVEDIYTGIVRIEGISSDIMDLFFKDKALDFSKLKPWYKNAPVANQFFILKNGESSSGMGYYNPITETVEQVHKTTLAGVKTRNAEQIFAGHALLNKNVNLVTLEGKQGTGKTLLAVAAAIEQKADYTKILIARPTIPLKNKDLGYLPGNIDDKLKPYLESIYDNIDFIKQQSDSKAKKNIEGMTTKETKQGREVDPKIKAVALEYIRGRTFSNAFIIIDEAQNLTPDEKKAIITRAGENTKIVFCGGVDQIDNPYLNSASNGLAYVIEKCKGNPMYAHVKLEKGERSPLADMGATLL